jgi:large subunit ribosomal protein L1
MKTMAEAKKKAAKQPEVKKKAAKKAEVVAETAPVAEAPEAKIEVELVEATETKPTAKSGKRSAKASREEQQKQAKEDRKATTDQPAKAADAAANKPLRTKLERAGKKYREAAKLVDKQRVYNLSEALELAAKTNPTKFDSSVELHVNLSVDPKQADQNIRATVSLPAGTGKTLRVAVFAQGDDIAKAKSAGADIAGVEELAALLDKEQIDFDVLIAKPDLMGQLAKYARLLGPKGLMPNPKSGTVAADVAKAVTEAKAGRIEFRVDSNGIIHCAIGKSSFGAEKLLSNAQAVISAIKNARPASVKGGYIKSAYLTTTMGPSIKVEI